MLMHICTEIATSSLGLTPSNVKNSMTKKIKPDFVIGRLELADTQYTIEETVWPRHG